MEAYCRQCDEVLTGPEQVRQHLGHRGLKTDDEDQQRPVRVRPKPR